MKYGFRMHELYVARGVWGRKAIDILKTGPSDDEDYLPRLLAYLDELEVQAEALDGKPALTVVADGADTHVGSEAPGTPRVRFLNHEVHGRRVSLTLRYGRLGEYASAMARLTKDDADLLGRSPDREFRAEILVPSKGTHGLMASEVIGGASPGDLISTWISWTSRAKLGADHTEKLMTPLVAEPDKVDDLLAGNGEAWLRLAVKDKAADGVRNKRYLELIDHALTGSRRDDVFAVLRAWREEDRKVATQAAAQGKKPKKPNTKKRVQALVQAARPEAADLGFNDGEVYLDEGSGRYARVTPSRANEVFTSVISEHNKPGQSVWDDAVHTRLMGYAKQWDLSVAWS